MTSPTPGAASELQMQKYLTGSDDDLVDVCMQVYARSCMYNTKGQHDAAMAYCAELKRRLRARTPAPVTEGAQREAVAWRYVNADGKRLSEWKDGTPSNDEKASAGLLSLYIELAHSRPISPPPDRVQPERVEGELVTGFPPDIAQIISEHADELFDAAPPNDAPERVEAVLDADARVGFTLFRKGIKWSTVIACAQRLQKWWEEKGPVYTGRMDPESNTLNYDFAPPNDATELVEESVRCDYCDGSGFLNVLDEDGEPVLDFCDAPAHDTPNDASGVVTEDELIWKVCDAVRASTDKECLRCPRTCTTQYGEGIQMCYAIAEEIIELVRAADRARKQTPVATQPGYRQVTLEDAKKIVDHYHQSELSCYESMLISLQHINAVIPEHAPGGEAEK